METRTLNTQMNQSFPSNAQRREGFSLVEIMISMVILSGIVLAMGMSTTNFQRKVTDSGVRTRAQSVAEMQLGRARAWPTYSTLSQLSTTRFNGTSDGLTSTTTVSVDSTNKMNITKVTVTVTAVQSNLLPNPVVRSISIAAP